MKRFYFLLVVLSVALSYSLHAQKFTRLDTISCQPKDFGGYGNIVAGVDLDKDGKVEIYACNSNANDKPDELIPRLYKYELDGGKWKLVWNAQLDATWQNTWPSLAVADLDKDGKMEIVWGPANWIDTDHKNPGRIFVFEVAGDGTDNLGVSFFGSVIPNAKYTISDVDDKEIRPIRWFVNDIDKDGKDEIIFADRSASNATKGGFHFGIISVDKIPDDGNNSEKWTIEASGKTPGIGSLGTANKTDLAIIDNVVYLFDQSGTVYTIKYASNTWSVTRGQTGLIGGVRSWKASEVVDLNNDNKKEIVVANYSGAVYLLQQATGSDSLVSAKIGSVTGMGFTRLVGSASGDLDGDGKLDFVFGSYAGFGKPNGAIFRFQYKGGAIADSNNYKMTMIDSLLHTDTGQFDVIAIANVDNQALPEVLYSSGYPSGVAEYWMAPITILKYQAPSSVERENSAAPVSYYMTQNYPNPFNPATTIKFGLQTDALVSLKVFNILGQQVASLIDNQQMNAGTYNVNFDASNLSSGTYIYQLNYNNQRITRKMQLMK